MAQLSNFTVKLKQCWEMCSLQSCDGELAITIAYWCPTCAMNVYVQWEI